MSSGVAARIPLQSPIGSEEPIGDSFPPGEAMGAAAPEVLSDRPIRTPREGCPYNPFFTVGTPVPGCPVHRPLARPGCFAEATKKFLFPISFLLNSILWKTLVFSTGMC